MNWYRALVLGLLMAGVIILSCTGQKESAVGSGIAAYLPVQLDQSGITRVGEVRVFVGDSLYEYINGGAEMYHRYGFVEVATAYYQQGKSELVADIYRFADPDYAFGMFSTLRPAQPETVPLGVEGFTAEPTVFFVKGKFMATVLGYDQSPATISAVRMAAEALERILPGTTDWPAMFSLFPQNGRIAGTQRIHAESYLGQASLSDMYTLDCFSGSDTLTFFLTDDESGEKFARWSGQAGVGKTSMPGWVDCPYDNGNYFIVSNNYYGLIVAGLKGGRLLGIVGYDEKHEKMLIAWVNSLSQESISAAGD